MNRSSAASSSARQTAQRVRLDHERGAKRSRLLLRWGIVGGLAALLAVVAVVIVATSRAGIPTAGPAPAYGNQHGGITLTSPTQLIPGEDRDVDAETVALPDGTSAATITPGGVTDPGGQGPVPVIAWVDVNCVHCADFESAYAEQIRSWLQNGDITMEYRTVAFLDRNSTTAYSSRAANALSCTAETSPQAYLPFLAALFANFPNGELDNSDLASHAEDTGAEDITACLEEDTFRPWVSFVSKSASADGITGTPTVYVDGKELASPADFESAVTTAIAARND
ncbi:DsbA family protein [Arthrobacter sp. CP30]